MADPLPSSSEYAIDLARGLGGAVFFAFPLLMTMEMWWLGFHMDRSRLLLFLIVNFFVLVGLAWFVGFERGGRLREMLLGAVVAYGIGIVGSALLLTVFGIIETGMNASEVVGKIAVQAIPASLGAMLARKELAEQGDEEEAEELDRAGYAGQLFVMAAGALYVSFNVAPTQEMVVIAFKMDPPRTVALVVLSVVMLHAFVYSIGFSGQEPARQMSFRRIFLVYTLAGYGIALCVSVYVLWTFGRFEGTSLPQIAVMIAVMGFPSALGAAAARLVV